MQVFCAACRVLCTKLLYSVDNVPGSYGCTVAKAAGEVKQHAAVLRGIPGTPLGLQLKHREGDHQPGKAYEGKAWGMVCVHRATATAGVP